MTEKPMEPTTIVRHANAVFGPMAMLAGMELDLFSALGDGSRACVGVNSPSSVFRTCSNPQPQLMAASLLRRMRASHPQRLFVIDDEMSSGRPMMAYPRDVIRTRPI